MVDVVLLQRISPEKRGAKFNNDYSPSRNMASLNELPVNADDRGSYVVWDLRDWDGDLDTMERINEAWVETHQPDSKQATISVFPSDVVVDDKKQEFISSGWNEACKITGIECVAVVSDVLKAMAVENQIDAPGVSIDSFDDVDAAVQWVETELT